MGELTEKAISVIGEDRSDDYKIAPTEFPSMFDESAPELSKVLKHSTFVQIANRYEHHDNEAIQTQGKFKRFADLTTVSICVAAVSGSLLAALAATNFESWYIAASLFILGLISTIGGGLAVFCLHLVNSQKLLERWMSSRAKAETERLGYFSSLARHLVKHHQNDRYLYLLYLCMFKRYQIDIQLLYYTARSRDHRISHGKTATIGAVAALCLALGAGAMGMVGAFVPKVLPFATLGTIGAAISIYASRREELNQDERNSERYMRTADILSRLAEKHDTILDAIEGGESDEILLKYVNAIADQLSLEHRQWTSNMGEMPATLAALEASISELNKQ
jgi:hypothetical protein